MYIYIIEKTTTNMNKNNMSDFDLVAEIIGQSSTDKLMQVASTLRAIRLMEFAELAGIIGIKKASKIAAAFEMGKRERAQEMKRAKITSSREAYLVFAPNFEALQHEEFWVMLLTTGNTVLDVVRISSGGVSGTSADPKIIFSKALAAKASSIIVAHNHPSGNLKPSDADIQITKKLTSGGKLLEVPVLDHIIICENSYMSFADEGYM